MATGTIGHIEAFQPGSDNWEQYTKRITQFFMANRINIDEAVFLTVIGAKAYSLLSNLIVPAKPAAKSYTDLVLAMRDHLKPTPLVTVEWFNFHGRNQE